MPQYFDVEPTVASKPSIVRLETDGVAVDLTADRGVFSWIQIDKGTQLLLDTVGTPDDGRLLDLGCGYGPIAITAAIRNPNCEVVAVDSNERARSLTEMNAARLKLANITVTDVAGGSLHTIWSNPPIRIGKTAMQELLLHALGLLAPHGQAWLVVQKHLGSDSLAEWLKIQGFEVDRIKSKKGYRIIRVSPAGSVTDQGIDNGPSG